MQLNAGPIQIKYENGFLRTLTANGEEVLRMIYFAFRDRNWNTARITIVNETVRSEADSFEVSYDWQVDDLGIRMDGSAHIVGEPDGRITFDFYGKAVNTFLRNRVGFCVLHPIEGLAGQPCRIENSDGQTTEAVFPDLISPHQPFLNVRTMTWRMVSGQTFDVAFEGDVFETEDQRNWTDASYKTYCTPLERPFPASVPAGTEVRQRVVIRPGDGSLFGPPSQSAGTQRITIGNAASEEKNFHPRIGLGYRADGPPLSPSEAEVLKTLTLSHLRADVFFNNESWLNTLIGAANDAAQLNVSLEIALFFGPDAEDEARRLVQVLASLDAPVRTLSLFEANSWRTTDALLKQIVPIFRHYLPNVRLGGGTDANFVELNRHRFDFRQVDFVTYSINPQVHAFDDQTLMENVAAQADTVRSAQALSGGKPVHVSPVTLLPRFNPDDAASATQRGVPPTDSRHSTPFNAEWTRRSLEVLTQAGVASVTYYETHGSRGLLNGEQTYPVLEAFRNRQSPI